MNFEAWTVDLTTLSATHESGFRIDVEGNPRDPSAVNPGRFPKGLNGIEQVRLLRHGVEAIAKAAKAGPGSQRSQAASVAGKAAAKEAVPRPVRTDKPKRPVLSLKRKNTEEV